MDKKLIRHLLLLDMAEAAYIEVNVNGDGNCFYRSIYNAAKYHKNATAFGKLISCLKFPENISEDDFVIKIRKYIVDAIDAEDDVFDIMDYWQRERAMREARSSSSKMKAQCDTYNLLIRFYRAAIDALRGKSIQYDTLLEEMSFELRTVIEKIGGYEYIANLEEEEAVELLKRLVKITIINSGVYASEFDIYILKYLLEFCGFRISIVEPHEGIKMPDSWPPELFSKQASLIPLYLRRVDNIHYHFYAPTDREDELRQNGLELTGDFAIGKLEQPSSSSASSSSSSTNQNTWKIFRPRLSVSTLETFNSLEEIAKQEIEKIIIENETNEEYNKLIAQLGASVVRFKEKDFAKVRNNAEKRVRNRRAAANIAGKFAAVKLGNAAGSSAAGSSATVKRHLSRGTGTKPPPTKKKGGRRRRITRRT